MKDDNQEFLTFRSPKQNFIQKDKKNRLLRNLLCKTQFKNEKGQSHFIAYSIVNKISKSGWFNNQRLLVMDSNKKQLFYLSKIPDCVFNDNLQQIIKLSDTQPIKYKIPLNLQQRQIKTIVKQNKSLQILWGKNVHLNDVNIQKQNNWIFQMTSHRLAKDWAFIIQIIDNKIQPIQMKKISLNIQQYKNIAPTEVQIKIPETPKSISSVSQLRTRSQYLKNTNDFSDNNKKLTPKNGSKDYFSKTQLRKQIKFLQKSAYEQQQEKINIQQIQENKEFQEEENCWRKYRVIQDTINKERDYMQNQFQTVLENQQKTTLFDDDLQFQFNKNSKSKTISTTNKNNQVLDQSKLSRNNKLFQGKIVHFQKYLNQENIIQERIGQQTQSRNFLTESLRFIKQFSQNKIAPDNNSFLNKDSRIISGNNNFINISNSQSYQNNYKRQDAPFNKISLNNSNLSNQNKQLVFYKPLRSYDYVQQKKQSFYSYGQWKWNQKYFKLLILYYEHKQRKKKKNLFFRNSHYTNENGILTLQDVKILLQNLMRSFIKTCQLGSQIAIKYILGLTMDKQQLKKLQVIKQSHNESMGSKVYEFYYEQILLKICIPLQIKNTKLFFKNIFSNSNIFKHELQNLLALQVSQKSFCQQKNNMIYHIFSPLFSIFQWFGMKIYCKVPLNHQKYIQVSLQREKAAKISQHMGQLSEYLIERLNQTLQAKQILQQIKTVYVSNQLKKHNFIVIQNTNKKKYPYFNKTHFLSQIQTTEKQLKNDKQIQKKQIFNKNKILMKQGLKILQQNFIHKCGINLTTKKQIMEFFRYSQYDKNKLFQNEAIFMIKKCFKSIQYIIELDFFIQNELYKTINSDNYYSNNITQNNSFNKRFLDFMVHLIQNQIFAIQITNQIQNIILLFFYNLSIQIKNKLKKQNQAQKEDIFLNRQLKIQIQTYFCGKITINIINYKSLTIYDINVLILDNIILPILAVIFQKQPNARLKGKKALQFGEYFKQNLGQYIQNFHSKIQKTQDILNRQISQQIVKQFDLTKIDIKYIEQTVMYNLFLIENKGKISFTNQPQKMQGSSKNLFIFLDTHCRIASQQKQPKKTLLQLQLDQMDNLIKKQLFNDGIQIYVKLLKNYHYLTPPKLNKSSVCLPYNLLQSIVNQSVALSFLSLIFLIQPLKDSNSHSSNFNHFRQYSQLVKKYNTLSDNIIGQVYGRLHKINLIYNLIEGLMNRKIKKITQSKQKFDQCVLIITVNLGNLYNQVTDNQRVVQDSVTISSLIFYLIILYTFGLLELNLQSYKSCLDIVKKMLKTVKFIYEYRHQQICSFKKQQLIKNEYFLQQRLKNMLQSFHPYRFSQQDLSLHKNNYLTVLQAQLQKYLYLSYEILYLSTSYQPKDNVEKTNKFYQIKVQCMQSFKYLASQNFMFKKMLNLLYCIQVKIWTYQKRYLMKNIFQMFDKKIKKQRWKLQKIMNLVDDKYSQKSSSPKKSNQKTFKTYKSHLYIFAYQIFKTIFGKPDRYFDYLLNINEQDMQQLVSFLKNKNKQSNYHHRRQIINQIYLLLQFLDIIEIPFAIKILQDEDQLKQNATQKTKTIQNQTIFKSVSFKKNQNQDHNLANCQLFKIF